MTRRAVAGLVLVALAGCSAEPAPEGGPAPSSPAPTSAAPTTEVPADPAPDPVLVVVGHATLPQLELSERVARRLTSGRVSTWRGYDVVADRPAPAALRAVERDPGTLAVVPADAVTPTVVAARVGGADPVRDDPRAVDLTVAGDVMLVRGVPDAAAALAPMSRRVRAADLAVGNLESTLSLDGSPTQGGDSFGGTPALLRPLGRAGFDVLSLANNHLGDYGTTAMRETVDVLAATSIAPVGAGRDVGAASEPTYVERAGVRFGFVAFNAIGETPRATATAPGALSVRMPPRTGPLVPADLDRVAAAVRRASREADVVVALPHWGTQYTHEPEPIQRVVARRLVASGADLVVGGHPHWVQGVDVVDGVPVLHSLGNFVFDMDFMEQTMEGVLLEATFWGADLKAVRLVPYRMDDASFAPRPVAGEEILADVWSASTGPFRG